MSPGRLRRLLSARDPESTSAKQGDLCEELRDAPADVVATTPDGCEECLQQGSTWVHLRLCLTCGHVGCCDTGPWRHATAHATETSHPVMRSYEAGEQWRWCYVHEQLG